MATRPPASHPSPVETLMTGVVEWTRGRRTVSACLESASWTDETPRCCCLAVAKIRLRRHADRGGGANRKRDPIIVEEKVRDDKDDWSLGG